MDVVLVDCEDKATNVVSKSGFLFCERFIVTVGGLLLPFFKKQQEQSLLNCDAKNICENLRFFVTKSDSVRCEAKVSAVFESANVKNCFEEIFGEWSVDSFENTFLARKSLALFVVLDISGAVCTENDVVNELVALRTKMRGFEGGVFKGREVLVESVPFGNKHFINSQSCGIVSNVLGENGCFILSDCPTVPGSEGSPLYLKESSSIAKIAPVGIVISSLTWWRGEWIGLTICVNLFAFLDEITSVKIEKKPPENSVITFSPLSGEEFLVQVTCTGNWGTGILLNKTHGILLTNSHVVSKGHKVYLRWGNELFHGEILYQTPLDSPCDLAILKTDPRNCRFMENVRFAQTEAVKGETVFAAGYSLFPQKLRTPPTLSRGTISQLSATMLKTTCCIHAGASGGALLRPNGELLGIIVSNAKLMGEKGKAGKITFPRVNMCIPVFAVKGVVERFLGVLDVGILKELDWPDVKLWREWIVLEGKL